MDIDTIFKALFRAYINKLIGLDPEIRFILKIDEEVFGQWNRDELKYITEDRMEVFR